VIDILTEPKAIIPNTEPNLEGVFLHYLRFWVAIYICRVGIALGSVLQICRECKYMKYIVSPTYDDCLG